MGNERSRPSWFDRAVEFYGRARRGEDLASRAIKFYVSDPKARKQEAIAEHDKAARQLIKEGKTFRAFGRWVAMQLAKAHSESKAGLALDVASVGSGKLLVKGVQGAARVVKGAKAVRGAKTMMEIDRTLKPVRAASGRTRPLAKTRHAVLEGAEKAAERVEEIAPKFIEPLKVAGKKIVSPRRALQAAGKVAKGIKTEVTMDEGSLAGAAARLTRARPARPVVPPRPAVQPTRAKPLRSVLTVGPHAPLDPKYHWVFKPEVVTRSQAKPQIGATSKTPISSIKARATSPSTAPKWSTPTMPTGRRDPYPRQIKDFRTTGQRQAWLRSYYRANPQARRAAQTEARTIINWAHKHLR